jgi:hypothetical protein
MLDVLAAAAPADPQLSGAWVLALLGKIFAGAVLIIGAVFTGVKRGEKKEREKVKGQISLEPPIPEVPVRKVMTPVTYEQHKALADRMTKAEVEIKEVRAAQSSQFVKILEAGQERETRLTDKLDNIARAIHARIDANIDAFKNRS